MADIVAEPVLEAEGLGDVLEADDPDDAVVNCPIRSAYMADGATVDDVRAVVEQNPSLLMTADGGGWLPVHWAAEELEDIEIFRYLVERCPESLDVRTIDVQNYLPIHAACAPCFSIFSNEIDVDRVAETVRIILEKRPETARAQAGGRYPLEFMKGGRFFHIARRIVEVWPQAIDSAYENGSFLLHDVLHSPGESEESNFGWAHLLVARRPRSVREKTPSGSIPLHFIRDNTPPGVVVFLVQHWRDSVRLPNSQGYLPLHFALDLDWHDEDSMPMLDFLYQLFPEAVSVRAKDGSTPLSVAAKNGTPLHGTPLQGIRYLVEKCPDSVRVRDKRGLLPIHLVFERIDWDDPHLTPIVQYLIEQYPASLFEETGEGDLPLHLLTTRRSSRTDQVTSELVGLLVNAAPATVRILTKKGSIPLLSAVRNDFPVDSVRRLVDAWPMSCRIGDTDGMIALHLAVTRRRPSLEQLDFLHRRCRESIRTATHNGSTALHLALARSDPPMDVVPFLVERDSGLLQCSNRDGMRPVHIAAAHNDSPAALRYLIEQDPQSLSWTDNKRSTLLHLVLARRVPPMQVVQFLVEQDPGLLQRSNLDGMRPVHIAAAHNESPQALKYLIEQAPRSLRRMDRTGSLALHTALRHGKDLAFVRLLVNGFRKSICHPDESGSLPLHVLLASGFAKLDVVRYLITHQRPALACLQHRNHLGYAPLHVAAMRGVPHDVLFALVRSCPKLIYEREAAT